MELELKGYNFMHNYQQKKNNINMKKDSHNYIIVVILLALASFAGVYSAKEDADTRDYAYEAYIEKTYEEDINYFLDVISESDEFIEYCEKHPEWAE